MLDVRPLTLTVATLVLAFVAPPLALADPDRAKWEADARQLVEGGQVEADLLVTEAGQGGGNPGESRDGPGPSVEGGTTASEGMITYHWLATGVGCWYGQAGGEPVDGSPDGEIYDRVRVDRTTDPPTETLGGAACFDPTDPPPGLPAPPPPPSLEEVTALARELIIVPDIRTSPDVDVGGVTGLKTWFWYDGQDEVSVTVDVRGYAVTASMTPSRYYWDPDDPRAGLIESTTAGSETHPAATWTYETKDDYEVRVQVVWDGTWSFAGHGATADGDLPTIRATGSTNYQVDEVRSELTGAR